jgi:hypothetical protein
MAVGGNTLRLNLEAELLQVCWHQPLVRVCSTGVPCMGGVL